MSLERTVQRLKVRGPNASLIRHAGLLVEDALRTASLPGEGPALILLRRVKLAPFPAAVPPQTVARHLESRFRQQASEFVVGETADEQALAAAPAVRFRDALSAHMTLSRRLCRGEAPFAWCWSLVVTAYHPGLETVNALRAVARSLMAQAEVAVALPVWFAGLVHWGVAGPFLQRLGTDDASRLLSLSAGNTEVHARPGAHVVRQWQVLLGSARDWFGVTDPRWQWVCTMASVCGVCSPVYRQPYRTDFADSVALQGSAGFDPESPSGPVDAESDRTGRLSGQSAHLAHGDSLRKARRTSAQKRLGEARGDDQGLKNLTPSEHPTVSAHEVIYRASERPPLSAVPNVPPDVSGVVDTCDLMDGYEAAVATAAGGILFLLPVLEALGLPEWLEKQPDWSGFDIFRGAVRCLATRLRLPADDVVWVLAGAPVEEAPSGFVAPPHWRTTLFDAPLCICDDQCTVTVVDATGRVPLAHWEGRPPSAWHAFCGPSCPDVMPGQLRANCRESLAGRTPQELLFDAWLGAARRWLRRRVGIGLADLVGRHGRLTMTPTHLEMELALDQIDMRVRRAGLDVDPGWMSWLGRVVRYRYQNVVERGRR